jgi:spermidine/putrescine transport system substrate-binding protein
LVQFLQEATKARRTLDVQHSNFHPESPSARRDCGCRAAARYRGQAADLNALIWCDHADPALLQPFEEANGVKVNVKEFEGTGAGLAIVEQSQPGDWDVMVIDRSTCRAVPKRPVERCRKTSCSSPTSFPR